MKIAIIGTRGIPNEYGGFEKFAEVFAMHLAMQNIDTTVYCSSLHSNKSTMFNGVKRIICWDPEKYLGSFGQFIYDLLCILHARKQGYDIIIQLGYTSSSVWNFLLPNSAYLITNMDGMEWKRSKYNWLTKQFLKYAEKLAVKHSKALIADSEAIADYLHSKYKRKALFIPYGAELFNNPNETILAQYSLKPNAYYLAIARLEPENNLEMIIKGFLMSKTNYPLIIVGNTNTNFGKYLKQTYTHTSIHFTEGIYDVNIINNLRHYASIYFHGHSVGGTNPSLLEAMAAQANIAAHNNAFNKTALLNNATYFTNEQDIAIIIQYHQGKNTAFIQGNLQRLRDTYNWDKQNRILLNALINKYEG